MADTLFSDSGKLIKMEVDYSSTVDEKIPICEKLAEVILDIFNEKRNFDSISIFFRTGRKN